MDFGAAWVFLPVLGALLAHAPVLRFDLFPQLRRPIDGGRTLRGRRLLGDNKTWRGALAMFAGTFALALLLSQWPWYWSKLPGEVEEASPLAFAALLGVGTVVAELPTSLLKRRLDIAPGARRRSPLGALMALYDQGDFVPGIWLALTPIWVMSGAEAAASFIVVVGAHLVANLVGYAIGAREAPL